MAKIAVKVKKRKLLADKISDDLKVDLRNKPEPKQKQPGRIRLFLVIFLIVIIIFLSVNWFFSSWRKSSFADLVPEEAVVFSLIDQEAFYNQLSPFYQFLKEKWPYGQGMIAKMGNYLNQADLGFQADLEPLFEKQTAFMIMPADSETAFPFILLLEKKASLEQINHILNKIEPVLKKDYNFSSQFYRQVEITILNPLFASLIDNFYYAQIDDYLTITNSQELLKEIIDSVIDN